MIGPPPPTLLDPNHYLDVRRPAYEAWERAGLVFAKRVQGLLIVMVSAEARAALPELFVGVEANVRTRVVP